jgi:hypothetical protein
MNDLSQVSEITQGLLFIWKALFHYFNFKPYSDCWESKGLPVLPQMEPRRLAFLNLLPLSPASGFNAQGGNLFASNHIVMCFLKYFFTWRQGRGLRWRGVAWWCGQCSASPSAFIIWQVAVPSCQHLTKLPPAQVTLQLSASDMKWEAPSNQLMNPPGRNSSNIGVRAFTRWHYWTSSKRA